jgi:hypothetical protein
MKFLYFLDNLNLPCNNAATMVVSPLLSYHHFGHTIPGTASLEPDCGTGFIQIWSLCYTLMETKVLVFLAISISVSKIFVNRRLHIYIVGSL